MRTDCFLEGTVLVGPNPQPKCPLPSAGSREQCPWSFPAARKAKRRRKRRQDAEAQGHGGLVGVPQVGSSPESYKIAAGPTESLGTPGCLAPAPHPSAPTGRGQGGGREAEAGRRWRAGLGWRQRASRRQMEQLRLEPTQHTHGPEQTVTFPQHRVTVLSQLARARGTRRPPRRPRRPCCPG